MESNPTNEMMNAWFNNSTQMWKGWYDLMTSATNQYSNPGNVPNFTSPFGDANQELFNPLLYSFNAWKDILNQFQGGQNWQEASQKYADEFSKQLKAFYASPTKLVEDTNKLWQAYFEQAQKFNQLLGNYWSASINPLSQTLSGNSQPWIELNNLYWDMLYQPTLGNLLQSPTVGPARVFNAKIQEAFEAWTNLYRASIDSQALLSQIQRQSYEKLMQELVALAQKGEPVQDWRKFQQMWSRIADEKFEETFSQEENLKIRGKLVNALNSYRVQQHQLQEYWMRTLNLPLRSEIDEVHRSVYELRKEVKSLKKRLAAAEASAESDKSKASPTKSSKKTQSS